MAASLISKSNETRNKLHQKRTISEATTEKSDNWLCSVNRRDEGKPTNFLLTIALSTRSKEIELATAVLNSTPQATYNKAQTLLVPY